MSESKPPRLPTPSVSSPELNGLRPPRPPTPLSNNGIPPRAPPPLASSPDASPILPAPHQRGRSGSIDVREVREQCSRSGSIDVREVREQCSRSGSIDVREVREQRSRSGSIDVLSLTATFMSSPPQDGGYGASGGGPRSRSNSLDLLSLAAGDTSGKHQGRSRSYSDVSVSSDNWSRFIPKLNAIADVHSDVHSDVHADEDPIHPSRKDTIDSGEFPLPRKDSVNSDAANGEGRRSRTLSLLDELERQQGYSLERQQGFSHMFGDASGIVDDEMGSRRNSEDIEEVEGSAEEEEDQHDPFDCRPRGYSLPEGSETFRQKLDGCQPQSTSLTTTVVGVCVVKPWHQKPGDAAAAAKAKRKPAAKKKGKAKVPFMTPSLGAEPPTSATKGPLQQQQGNASAALTTKSPSLKAFRTTPHAIPHIQYSAVYNTGGRVGIYLPDERSKVLQKYRGKKSRRDWGKKVRYGSRKESADSRERVGGRFVKKDKIAADLAPKAQELRR